MSTTSVRVPLPAALNAALRFRQLFCGDGPESDLFDRWEFAGSVRRRREFVGDIEHVVIPRTGIARPVGAFIDETVNLVTNRLDWLLEDGVVEKQVKSDGRTRWGPLYRALVFEGRVHEVFLADERNWGCILAIRTGPAELSACLQRRFNAGGNYRQHDGYLRYVSGPAAGEIVSVPTEQGYFNLAGVPFVGPEMRDSLARRIGA